MHAVPYHNWYHAFNVTQCMFAIMRQPEVQLCVGRAINLLPLTIFVCSHFSKLEMMALIVGCLCHDLDHRCG